MRGKIDQGENKIIFLDASHIFTNTFTVKTDRGGKHFCSALEDNSNHVSDNTVNKGLMGFRFITDECAIEIILTKLWICQMSKCVFFVLHHKPIF